MPVSLDALHDVSRQLAALREAEPGSPSSPPDDNLVHSDLAAVLCCGAYALKRQRIDLDKLAEYTADARKRGMRRKVWVFGWPSHGELWYATPEAFGAQAEVLVIKRRERLATESLDLQAFIDRLTQEARDEVAALEAEAERAARHQTQKEEAKPVVKKRKLVISDESEDAPYIPEKLRGSRQVKVVLPRSEGATVVADGKSVEFSGEELGYVIWSLEALELLNKSTAPDLSRWEARCLRYTRLDQVPDADHPKRAEYDENWMRLTLRDRSATSRLAHQLPSWKLDARGIWVLAPSELDILRRANKATPPRHKPSKQQKAIWSRFTELMGADDVALEVH